MFFYKENQNEGESTEQNRLFLQHKIGTKN